MTNHQIDMLIRVLDTDGDGEISIRYSESRLEVKNLEELERVLLSYLAPDQKTSASTSVRKTNA